MGLCPTLLVLLSRLRKSCYEVSVFLTCGTFTIVTRFVRDQVKWIDLHSSTLFNSLDESAKKILTALCNNEQIFTDRTQISTNEVKQHVSDEIRSLKDGLQYLNNGVEQVLLILRTPSPGGIPALHPIDRQPGKP